MAENSSQENSSHGRFVAWVTLFSFFPSLNALKNLSIVLLLLLLHYTHYIIQNYLHFNQNLAFLSHFLHPFFIAWVTLFSFFPSLNALRHLSIVLFTPFYCLIRPVLHKTAYISIKTLHSFLISFATTMRRIFRRRIFLRRIFRIPFNLYYGLFLHSRIV